MAGEIFINFMKKLDYISGIVIFLFAVILFFQSRSLTVWGESGPSSGFFPLILSILLGFLSLIIIFRAWLQTQTTQEIFKILGPKRGKFFLYITSFFVFGFIFTKLGYSLTLTAFLIFIVKIVERQSWKTSLGVIIISIIVSYILFVNFLSVPLPEGILSPVVQRLK